VLSTFFSRITTATDLKFDTYIDILDPLPNSKVPDTGLYPKPNEFNLFSPILFL
jgi:hypothetical protein